MFLNSKVLHSKSLENMNYISSFNRHLYRSFGITKPVLKSPFWFFILIILIFMVNNIVLSIFIVNLRCVFGGIRSKSNIINQIKSVIYVFIIILFE